MEVNPESSVIKLSYLSTEIGVIAMEDRESKNTFSPQFIQGLLSVFATIRTDAHLKVVVIHGFENFFCCGGTQAELVELSAGTKNFTDLGFYRLLLDCPVPVIAAVQGHAIGGGLAFATYADMLVMAEEAFYSANFMKYGFTPGFGSTYFFSQKFGSDLAANMLFGAQNYQGSELKAWGVGAKYVKKTEVIPQAIDLARMIAQKPRATLMRMKQRLTAADQHNLPHFIEQEIIMHKQSFAQAEVKMRIQQLFGK